MKFSVFVNDGHTDDDVNGRRTHGNPALLLADGI